MARSSRRLVVPGIGVLLLCLASVRAWGFVDVALSGNLATAPRWSATEAVSGRGLADGKISVFITPNFAENIAIAVTGTAMPQDVADVEAAVQAAFDAWESPVLQFEVTFDGAAVRGQSVGGEIDLFDVLSTDPDFASSGANFGVTYMTWSFLANRLLTNGSVLAGNSIIGADILIATDRLALIAPAFTREQQLRLFQRLIMHELGHAVGFHHPHDGPSINYDSDTNPNNAILIDPSNPLATMALSPNLDTLAVMNQIPPDINALFYTSLRNDDRGGRDVLYPALGVTQDVCQPFPVGGCRAALKSKLQIRDDASDDGKDKLLWKWVKGAATVEADFGSPQSSTRYSLCVYRGAIPALLAELALPPGDGWQPLPGKGFKYGHASRLPHGVQKTLLRAGAQDKAKIILKAKGANLPDGLLPVGTTPVVAQLLRADTMGCWQGTYDGAGISSDDATQFKGQQ
jgi:hypothetical protein